MNTLEFFSPKNRVRNLVDFIGLKIKLVYDLGEMNEIFLNKKNGTFQGIPLRTTKSEKEIVSWWREYPTL